MNVFAMIGILPKQVVDVKDHLLLSTLRRTRITIAKSAPAILCCLYARRCPTQLLLFVS